MVGGNEKKGSRHLGVSAILVFIVLVPLLSTAVFIAIGAKDSWSNRVSSQQVASTVSLLTKIAKARSVENQAQVPIATLQAGYDIVGLTEAEVSQVMGMNLAQLLPSEAKIVKNDPIFGATPALRGDRQLFEHFTAIAPNVGVSYDSFTRSVEKFAQDVDSYWFSVYSHLQSQVSSWSAPQQFEIHVTAMRQIYQALIESGYNIEGTSLVLESSPTMITSIGIPAGQELIQSYNAKNIAFSQFKGYLGPDATRAWNYLLNDPADKSFAKTTALAFNVALKGTKSPFLGNPVFAGHQLQAGLKYFTDLDNVVSAAASDLHNSATAQASSATRSFIIELVVLALVAGACAASVIGGTKVITVPLKKLSKSAESIHEGDFELDELPDKGPAEVVTVNRAFNNMASTLKGVEEKTVALAGEDLANPMLQTPLPGRVGAALQSAVDRLVSRIREREIQRQQLHEAATHDALTGLLNRAATFEFLRTDVERRRQLGEKVAVLFADLNGLKPLNDQYGHDAGDAAIRSTAEAIHEAIGECDVSGRLGGDEFLIVLCSRHSIDPTSRVQEIQDSISRRSVPVSGGDFVPLEASVGTALAECDAETDPMELVRQADSAMYEAKRAARATRDHLAAASAAAHAAETASVAALAAAQTGDQLAKAAMAAAEAAALASAGSQGPVVLPKDANK